MFLNSEVLLFVWTNRAVPRETCFTGGKHGVIVCVVQLPVVQYAQIGAEDVFPDGECVADCGDGISRFRNETSTGANCIVRSGNTFLSVPAPFPDCDVLSDGCNPLQEDKKSSIQEIRYLWIKFFHRTSTIFSTKGIVSGP